MNRRETIKLMAAAPMAAGFSWSEQEAQAASDKAAAATNGKSDFEPAFFTEHELNTVNVLVDHIIPADDRSGSATEAGVPAFMDFMMMDRPFMQLPMRGGLAWIDAECRKRFESPFVECTPTQQTELLDAIAYPEIASPDVSAGVAFFNSFRDLTASGFWSSKMGVEDLQYIGNEIVHEWKGCPEDILEALGLNDSE